MARTQPKKWKSRRFFSEELKQEGVQMLLDSRWEESGVSRKIGRIGQNPEKISGGVMRWGRKLAFL
jgi:hypothetical protein